MHPARNGASAAPARRHRRETRGIAGFTALEVLVTMAIAAILVAVGVPAFTEVMRQVRVASAMNQITSDLYAAKGEAIKRNTRVLVCARGSSATSCATVTDWSTGWLVCFDADANGNCDTSTTTAPNPLIVRNAIHDSLTLTGPSAPLTFTSTGPTTAAATLTLSGTWDDAPSKQAAVALTGFIGTS
jgi:type IV fimbrial biogenesis protein FimT